MSYRAIIDQLCDAALHPGKTIAATHKETGKDLIGCFPIHTPDEIIYAAGCIPVGMWGGTTELQLADKYLQSFCCSVMRTNIEFGMRGVYNDLKAVIIPTFCDTLKCIEENWKVAVPQIPVIGMAYPQHRDLKAGIEYMISETKRVKHELELILGKIILEEKVEEAFAVYEDYRATMRAFTEVAAKHPEIIGAKTRYLLIKAGQFMDKAVYTQKMKEIIAGLQAEAEVPFKGTKVVLTGLMPEPVEILDVFEENQVAVVGDDMSLGSRLWRTPAREDIKDVYEKMAYIVADQEGDTFLYEPQKKRGQLLIDMVQKLGAAAVVVMMMKFCDPEEYDYPIYKAELEKAGIPELYLETDQQLTTFEQVRTRVQSFTEMLL